MSEFETLDRTLSPRRAPPRELEPDRTKGRPASVTINQPVAEVFAFVRDLSNFSKFVRGLIRAERLDAKTTEFTFSDPSGEHVYQIETMSELTDHAVTWRTLSDGLSDAVGALTVEPAVGNRGTVVSLKMHFDDRNPPGKLRGLFAYYAGRDPKTESYVNLRRLKAYLETGEVPTIEGQPSGRAL